MVWSWVGLWGSFLVGLKGQVLTYAYGQLVKLKKLEMQEKSHP
jgi:hypothetical protein